MKELVISRDKKAVTTSKIIAEYFDKEHKVVLSAIRDLISKKEEFIGYNFMPSDYKDSRGKTQPIYEIDRDGFTLLVMGFTGDKALDFKLNFIKAFNAMEDKLRNNQLTQLQIVAQNALALVAQEKKLLEHDDRLKQIEYKIDGMSSNTNYYTVLAYCIYKGIKLPISKTREVGKKATALSKRLSIQIGKVPDEKFYKVNSYAVEVLDEIIEEFKK